MVGLAFGLIFVFADGDEVVDAFGSRRVAGDGAVDAVAILVAVGEFTFDVDDDDAFGAGVIHGLDLAVPLGVSRRDVGGQHRENVVAVGEGCAVGVVVVGRSPADVEADGIDLVGELVGDFLFETAFGADDEDAEGPGYLRGDFLEDALRGAYPSNLPYAFDGVLVHTKPSRNVDFGYYFSIVAQMSDFVKMLKALRVVCAGLWLLWRRMDFLLCGDFEPRLIAET